MFSNRYAGQTFESALKFESTTRWRGKDESRRLMDGTTWLGDRTGMA